MISNAYNRDCLEAMREMPDNFWDLAVVDPPYGAGFTETGGCQGWFAKDHQDSQSVNVERERERYNRFGNPNSRFERYKSLLEPGEPGQSSTAKKLSRGTWPLEKNTSTNFSASHAIKLYGAATTLTFLRHGAS